MPTNSERIDDANWSLKKNDFLKVQTPGVAIYFAFSLILAAGYAFVSGKKALGLGLLGLSILFAKEAMSNDGFTTNELGYTVPAPTPVAPRPKSQNQTHQGPHIHRPSGFGGHFKPGPMTDHPGAGESKNIA